MTKSSIDEKNESGIVDAEVVELLFEKDNIIERMARENAGQRFVIEAAKLLIEKTIMDADKLSLQGGISLLLKENKRLAKMVEYYEKS